MPRRIRLCPITGQFFVKPTVLYGGVSNQEEDSVASPECLKKWCFSKHNEGDVAEPNLADFTATALPTVKALSLVNWSFAP